MSFDQNSADAAAPVSRNIPKGMKRQVRQECHFGCVICGMPLFEYDHIQQFAEAKRHDPANIALLCPNHHSDKTAGRLSTDRVFEARRLPFNGQRSETAAYGLEVSNSLDVWLGSNHSAARTSDPGTEYSVVWINGASLFTLHAEGQSYTYSALVTDETGMPVLRIDHGNLSVATGVWDYRYEGSTMSIRRGEGNILIEADINDRVFALRRGAFVDEYETGVLVKPNGDVVFVCSQLEIGTCRDSEFRGMGAGMSAVVRRSCFGGDIPKHFSIVREWSAEFESRAAQLRLDMEEGKPPPIPGGYPIGLSRFEPYPR